MLPNLGQLLLHDVADTMGFYSPTDAELAHEQDWVDPITLESPIVTERGARLTFRVWLRDDMSGNPIYKFYSPWALWSWVKEHNSMPDRTRLWHGDWWELCRVYNPWEPATGHRFEIPEWAYSLPREVDAQREAREARESRERLAALNLNDTEGPAPATPPPPTPRHRQSARARERERAGAMPLVPRAHQEVGGPGRLERVEMKLRREEAETRKARDVLHAAYYRGLSAAESVHDPSERQSLDYLALWNQRAPIPEPTPGQYIEYPYASGPDNDRVVGWVFAVKGHIYNFSQFQTRMRTSFKNFMNDGFSRWSGIYSDDREDPHGIYNVPWENDNIDIPLRHIKWYNQILIESRFDLMSTMEMPTTIVTCLVHVNLNVPHFFDNWIATYMADTANYPYASAINTIFGIEVAKRVVPFRPRRNSRIEQTFPVSQLPTTMVEYQDWPATTMYGRRLMLSEEDTPSEDTNEHDQPEYQSVEEQPLTLVNVEEWPHV